MKKTCLLYGLALASFFSYSQDPLFLNTNQSLVYLNPSFAGSSGGARNQFSFRNQWPVLTGRHVTYLNSFDAYIRSIKGGIAVSVLTDDVSHGTLKTTNFNIAYAQYLSVSELKIIPSVQIGYVQKVLDVNNLYFGDMIDPRYGIAWQNSSRIPSPNKTYLDVSSGLLFNYKDLYAGASVSHLNRPDIGLLGSFRMPVLYNFHASYNRRLSGRTLLNFSLRGISQQHRTIVQLALNAVLYKYLLAGIGLRSTSSPIVSVGWRNSQCSILLSYDKGLYKRSEYSAAGAWELMLGFRFGNKAEKEMPASFES